MASTDATVRTASGRTLAYAETGLPDGFPLFYFHGIPGSRLDFHQPFNSPALDGACVRMIGIDRPGYGGSDIQSRRRYRDWADDVATVADALGIDRFGIIAYSGGGPYAVACALGLPERVISVGIASGVGPAEMPNFRRSCQASDICIPRPAGMTSSRLRPRLEHEVERRLGGPPETREAAAVDDDFA